ncbi:hypothetical protein LOAG_17955 [Loa loa]|uniref:Uncharacterized protein n=1 Tax=Loa loa TaxID=7209 RepID=A0A1S0UHD1_LOALO|nr:hypothetical protein LOAG_17955 [Loa loa]EJD74778.1 hypothetical protein LOAG_17955 [Loa loa]
MPRCTYSYAYSQTLNRTSCPDIHPYTQAYTHIHTYTHTYTHTHTHIYIYIYSCIVDQDRQKQLIDAPPCIIEIIQWTRK